MSTEGSAVIAVEVARQNGSAVVIVGGELEFGTAATLRAALSDLAQAECDSVIIDLAAVEFMDSTGLSLLVQAKQRFESLGRQFRLRAPIPRVARVFETSGLAEVFGLDADDR